ncbi:DUF7289 family protein [Halorubrum tibetense]|uniref:Flagellin n=1 Tax=Halorubrum tibetense TaxID=175631 RepID=A0ABD5S9P5_9EURY
MTRGRLGETGGDSPDERAVSDVVGYVLVFALVTATLAAVFTIGFVGLEERQDAERVENVERAFDVLDDNVRDIQRYEDPSRATEVRLSGGSMSLAEPTTVTVEQLDAGNNTVGNVTTRTSNAITYTRDDTTIGYDMGARFRTQGDTTVFRSGPRFVAEDGKTVLPIVRTRLGDGSDTVRGDGTVQVSTETAELRWFEYPESDVDPADVEDIRIRIDSQRADAWGEYLERTGGFSVVETGETSVSARLEHDDAVYIRVYVVDVSFRR